MQEQVPSNITPEQGWSMMKGILDREMPARKKSRRFLVWWSTAVMMLIGLSGFVMMMNHSAATTPSLPAQQPSPAIPEKPVDENQSPETKDIFANAKSQDLQTTAQSDQSAHNHLKSQSTKKTIASSNSTNPVSLQGNVNLLSISTPVSLTENISLPSIALKADNDDDVAGVARMQGVEQSSMMAAIPVLPIDAFVIAEPEVDQVAAKLITPKKKRKASFSPNVELASLAGEGGAGLSVGLGLDAKISPRITITGAVGYRSFDPTAEFLGFASEKDAAFDIPASNQILHDDLSYQGSRLYVAAESLPAASYSDVVPVVENLNQWQTQFGLSYKVSKKFSMEAGMGVSFHTRAFSEYPIVQQTLDGSGPNISTSLNDYDLVRQSNTSFYAGLTYHLGKHVSLKAQWWQTNQPYLALENTSLVTGAPASVDREDYIRGLNLGIKYTIL